MSIATGILRDAIDSAMGLWLDTSDYVSLSLALALFVLFTTIAMMTTGLGLLEKAQSAEIKSPRSELDMLSPRSDASSQVWGPI